MISIIEGATTPYENTDKQLDTKPFSEPVKKAKDSFLLSGEEQFHTVNNKLDWILAILESDNETGVLERIESKIDRLLSEQTNPPVSTASNTTASNTTGSTKSLADEFVEYHL